MERPIAASTVVRASIAEACALLLDDPAAALAPTMLGGDRRGPVLTAELTVGLQSGGAAVQEIALELGAVEGDRVHGPASFPLAWTAVGKARLFPTFRGLLVLAEADDGDTVLLLDGMYLPPLRLVGSFADGLLGHRLARASLTRFVTAVGARIDAAVLAGHARCGVRPTSLRPPAQ